MRNRTSKPGEERKGFSCSHGCGPVACFLVLAVLLQGGCRGKPDIRGAPKENAAEQPPRGDDALRLQPLPPQDGEDVVIDPFCGLKIRKPEAAATLERKGVTYHFCTLDHMEAFKKDPEKYLIVDTNDDL
ncbi:MAG: YHS domain-containing protein [Pseudomonadota bacterium]